MKSPNTLWASVLFVGAAVACSGTADLDEQASGQEPSGPELGEDTTSAVKNVMANPDETALEGLSDADVGAILNLEKIGNGTVIDYDDAIGNGIVFIVTEVPQGFAVCTAQVINRWFLLTAGHCTESMFPGGTNEVGVLFTDSAGNLVAAYSGPGVAGAPSDWRRDDRDVGLVFLENGMTTCQDTLAGCSGSQPNVPVNSVFQYFRPSLSPAVASNYPIVGYGATDHEQNGTGVLRRGSMAAPLANFTDPQSFTFIMSWQTEGESRSCPGDSGGPLVALVGNRLLYTGIGSRVATGSCTASSGLITYTGLTEDTGSWLLTQVLSVRNFLGLGFDCTAGTSGNLSMFACDNDGTVF